MDNKYIIYSLLILLIFIVGIGVVSAGDINTTDAAPIVENDNVDTIMSDTTDDDVIAGGNTQKDLTKKEIDSKKNISIGVEKTATKITVNSMGDVQKDNYVIITGKYTAVTGINLTYTPIKIVINGATYTNKTNGNGIYSYRFKASTPGTNNVTVSYAGNTRFKGDSAKTTFKVSESGKTATKITVNSIGDVQKDAYVTVTGRYTAVTGINLTYTPIKMVINGVTYTNKTNAYGIYSYTFKASTLGTNNVTVSYAGNSRFIGASASTNFNVVNKTGTKITVNTLGDIQKDSYVTVTGRYTAVTGINLTYTPIKIVINGATYTNKTNGNGIYSYTFKASTLSTNNVSVSYAGNARFIGASASTAFNVVNKTATIITVNSIGDVQKDAYVTVTGRYTASTGINLTYTPIKIVINGVTYTNKTNGNGIYSYTFKASTLGTNNVSVSYVGNARFIGASASTAFNVVNKTATKITVNSLGTVQKDSYVTVTGRYTAVTGINLTYTPIRITINGVTYTNKTDAYGIYSYTFKAATWGTNNVTVAYPGNARFIGATAKTTLTVKGTATTRILLDPIQETEYSNIINIVGKCTDNEGNGLSNADISLSINGVKYNTTTDNYGDFNFYYQTKKVGVNDITVSYFGDVNHLGTTTLSQFTVTKKPTMTNIYVYNDEYNSNTPAYVNVRSIEGWGLDISYNITLYITIDGKTDYVTADEYGDYYFNFKAKESGTKITASFLGNEYYLPSSDSITYTRTNDNEDKISTRITVINTLKSTDESYIKIRGRFYDVKGNMLTYTPLTLEIDGVAYTTKTDGTGLYNFNYYGDVDTYHSLKVSYAGNKKYAYTQTKIVFKGLTEGNTLELLTPHSIEYDYDDYGNTILCTDNYQDITNCYTFNVGSDIFLCNAQYLDSQMAAGVHVMQNGIVIEEAPANVLIKAEFYFKNNWNTIIKVNYTDNYEHILETSLIDGYVPYKAVITFRERTAAEIKEWFSGWN